MQHQETKNHHTQSGNRGSQAHGVNNNRAKPHLKEKTLKQPPQYSTTTWRLKDNKQDRDKL